MEQTKKSLASRIPSKVWLLISFLAAMAAWFALSIIPATSRAFPNVFVTPHMAFYTDLSIRYMVKSSIESCVRDARGEENPWKVL